MCPTDITVYADAPTYPSIQEGLDRLADADQIIMHNGMMFDFPAIEHLYPNSTLRKEQIIDTLIYSRLRKEITLIGLCSQKKWVSTVLPTCQLL